jgi:short-subunit dehydrogenase
MIEQDTDAHIVNTASLGGLVASPGATLYGTTKFAVVGLSENLYLELQRGGFKPKVAVLCPGPVDTDILNSRRNQPAEFAHASPPRTAPATNALRGRAAEALKKGLSPRAVGEQVLAAIRGERFYIPTHPDLNAFIEQRMQDLLTGNDSAMQPSKSLMKKLNALKPRARQPESAH